MPQRPTSQPNEDEARPRAPLSRRLWRNQLDILLAIALTLAAAGMLMASYRG